MRGKVSSSVFASVIAGITPAYAGKSDVAVLQNGIAEDHPRLCGEKISSLDKAFGLLGSPPPMRGKAIYITATWATSRITPAYAGKRPCIRPLRRC